MFNVDMTRVREKIFFLITTRSTGQVVSIRQPRQRSVDWKNTFPSLRFRKFFFFFLYFIYLFSFYRYSTNNIQIETYKHYKIYNNYLNYKKKKKKKIE